MHDNNFDKNAIKSRMLTYARNTWDISDIRNLDPAIKLLIESLASEMSKLAMETSRSQARSLERLAELMAPELARVIHPSHLVIQATPLEKKVVMDKEKGFQYAVNSVEKLHFYPACPVQLFKGQIASVIIKGDIFGIIPGETNQLKIKRSAYSNSFSNSVWVGLKITDELPQLTNCSFFLDILHTTGKKELADLFVYTKWESEGRALTVTPGIYEATRDTEQGEKMTLSGYHSPTQMEKGVVKEYQSHFITVTSTLDNSPASRKKLPAELEGLYPEAEIEEKCEPLLWVKIIFPPAFDSYILEHLFITINAFPVLNKKLYSTYYKTNRISSIFPVEAKNSEYFFAVKAISDTNNKQYKELPYPDPQGDHYGTYIVKKGGIEKFDSRDARLYLANLIDILREESASFYTVGKGFLEEQITKMNEIINTIELKLAELKAAKELSSYIQIDGRNIGETIFIEYWTTNCEQGNGIKSGNTFTSIGDSIVDPGMILSLTTSYGGRNNPVAGSLDAYRYMLTSRDRIYTHTDIQNFCTNQFGHLIRSVEIKKGVTIGLQPKEGLIRTTDLVIRLKETIRDGLDETSLKETLLGLLQERSPEEFNYRIIITHS